MKRQPADSEGIIAKQVSDNTLISRIYKELSKLITKKADNLAK